MRFRVENKYYIYHDALSYFVEFNIACCGCMPSCVKNRNGILTGGVHWIKIIEESV